MKIRLIGPIVPCFVLTTIFWTCISAAAETPASASGETAALDELYRLDLLPRLQPGETCKMFGSYDRTGGNNDGFEGTYSKLRVEDGNSVLAEMEGPGCIGRIWFTHSEHGKPGLLKLKKEHLRIYLDGEKTPEIDVPLEDIFSGKLEGFPNPLVGESQGGYYCYVPIPYRKSCKVLVEGTGVRFYQIGYRTYPGDKKVSAFRHPPTASQKESLAAAVKAWSACGDFAALGVEETESSEKAFSLKAGESFAWDLPQGPRMVRAVYLSLKPEQFQNADDVRLQIWWDGAGAAAVDLPLSFFFCQSKQPSAFKSLLAGANGEQWYNFLAMPYRQSGKITLRAEKPLVGKFELLTTKLETPSESLGYLHAAYHEGLPTKTGKFHSYLDRQGKGRFVGVYLATDGQNNSKLPTWLEGDEQFTCDGELRIHGTGTEDGFNCGWYAVPGRLNGPGASPLTGFPVYRREGPRNIATAFRWYLSDPIPYEKSIQAELEHGGTNDVNANYRTAAFFYDAAP
jgi:hypothetical protein